MQPYRLVRLIFILLVLSCSTLSPLRAQTVSNAGFAYPSNTPEIYFQFEAHWYTTVKRRRQAEEEHRHPEKLPQLSRQKRGASMRLGTTVVATRRSSRAVARDRGERGHAFFFFYT